MSSVLLFGKLPAHGDFVSRGIAAEDRELLDLWLSSEMADARAIHGEAFEESFDAAPPWRFAWNDEGSWTAGALASSTDAVGRRFPLLLGRRGLSSARVSAAAEQSEELIYAALTQGLTADKVAFSLEPMTAPDTEAEQQAEGWWTLGSGEFPAAQVAGRQPKGLLATALTRIEEEA